MNVVSLVGTIDAQVEKKVGSNLDVMLFCACTATGVTPEQVQGKSRKRPIPWARHIYSRLAREYTDKRLVDIGRKINRHHATVIAGTNKAYDLLTDRDFSKHWEAAQGLYLGNIRIEDVKRMVSKGETRLSLVDSERRMTKVSQMVASYFFVPYETLLTDFRRKDCLIPRRVLAWLASHYVVDRGVIASKMNTSRNGISGLIKTLGVNRRFDNSLDFDCKYLFDKLAEIYEA